MAIRFKFRSSVNFDSLDIGGQPSISVRDLTARIIHRKNLISKDFDLVFSDALTGQEYSDPEFQILSGSSIIVKRVPAGSAPSAKVAIDSVEKLGVTDTGLVKTTVPSSMNTEGDNFDDFGIDLCPVPEVISYDSIEIDKVNDINSENTNMDPSRCSQPPVLRCGKIEGSDLSEAIPGGPNHVKIEAKEMQTKLKTEVEGCMKLEKAGNSKFMAIQSSDLPSELKCSLCSNFYKEAVMIPCCQHSFCKKCIHLVLVEKQRCPKCSSTKCRVENLLPNVSLRQAIEHFLESQIPTVDPDNDFNRYAPDGESGIQAKDISCAATVHKRERNLLHCSSATGRGSNQMVAESASESLARNNKTMDADGSSHPVNIKSGAQDWEVDDFQGENHLLNLPMHDEADSTTKKTKGSGVYPSGGNRNFAANDRYRKGGRSCYTCGSQDHLMRDCPAASAPFDRLYSGPVPGYWSTYWSGVPLPQMGPFQHSYGNPGMMPFNSTILPGPPFAVPSYLPSMYGGIPVTGGIMRMGAFAPPVRTIAEPSLSHLELSEQQDWKKKRGHLNENLQSEQSSDEGDGFNKQHEPERLNFHKSRVAREKGVNNYEDSFAQKSHWKQWYGSHSGDDIHSAEERHEKTSHSSITVRDRRPHLPGKSSLGVEERLNCSSWCSEDRHKCHYQDSERHDIRIGTGRSDSSQSGNQIKVEKDVKKKGERSSAKRHHQRHHSHSDSGSEPSFSCDHMKQQKEREFTHGSRHSRRNKHELNGDKWQMRSRSDEDCRGDHHRHKRKRMH